MKNAVRTSGTKISRQIRIYHQLNYTSFHGPQEIMTEVPGLSVRMLQRDIKDLTDAGCVAVKYDKSTKNYVKQAKQPIFSDEVEGKRRTHLIRLNRLCNLLDKLESTPIYAISQYITEKEEYDYLPTFEREHPDLFDKSMLDDIPIMPEIIDAREIYQKLYPDCSFRTMQRDFSDLNATGLIEVTYSRRFKIYLVYRGTEELAGRRY